MANSFTIIDNKASLSELIDKTKNLRTQPPSLYFDLKRVNRRAPVSILQLHDSQNNDTYLIDVHILGGPAFTTAGPDGKTLKDVLEDPAIPKVFFDVRNISRALFVHYAVELQNIEDIQLLETASRFNGEREQVRDLKEIVWNDAPLSHLRKQA